MIHGHVGRWYSGTTAERTAFTPDKPGTLFQDTDLGAAYWWDGAVWQPFGSGGPGSVAFTDLTDTFAAYTGLGGEFVKVKATEDGLETGIPVGGGDVLGPATSADNTISRFNGSDNKTIQGSLATIDDSGGVNIPTGQTYNINGSAHTHAGGVDAFTDLSDVPASYSGSGGKLVAVNSGATALEFVSPAEGGITAPVDANYVTTVASSTLTNEIVIPGLALPDRVPSSPNTEDDEFDGTSLDAKWTETKGAGVTPSYGTIWPSYLYAKVVGNYDYNIAQAYAPGGNFSLTAKFTAAQFGNYQNWALTVFDSTEVNGMIVEYIYNSGMSTRIQSRESSTNTVRNSITGMPMMNGYYLHLQRATNTWTAALSFDGLSWFPLNTYDKTFTPHHFTLTYSQASQTKTVLVGIDWVRRDWLTL